MSYRVRIVSSSMIPLNVPWFFSKRVGRKTLHGSVGSPSGSLPWLNSNCPPFTRFSVILNRSLSISSTYFLTQSSNFLHSIIEPSKLEYTTSYPGPGLLRSVHLCGVLQLKVCPFVFQIKVVYGSDEQNIFSVKVKSTIRFTRGFGKE